MKASFANHPLWARWAPALRRHAPWLLAALFGVLAAGPLLWHSGFLHTRGGGDSPFLLLRLHQLEAALRAGEFPVRWMPDAAYGYGYPFFNYYAALPYYLAALLRLYGFSYVAALKAVQTAALMVGAAGAYGLARAWSTGAAPGRAGPLSPMQALLAAAAYTFAPFHLANLYVRGDSLSELWAMAFYPLALLCLARCLERPTFGRALALAAVVAALPLTHNISALNFMPFLALYALLAGLSRWQQGGLAPLAVAALAGAWGLALAAFFWLPALRETGLVQIGGVTGGYFFYGNHFRDTDLVQTSFFYNPDSGPTTPTEPFAMGLAQTVLAAAGLVAMMWSAWRARRWTAGDTFVLLGLALSTFMLLPASAWVWANAPLLAYTQFPWRFLSIQALFTALLTARLAPSAAPAGARAAARAGRWAVPVALGLALAVAGLGRLRPDFIPLADSDVTPQRLHLLETFTANIGSTIGYEYLPSAVLPRPFTGGAVLGRAPGVKALSGTASGRLIARQGASQTWELTVTGGPATVALPTYYWPGWTVTVNGAPVPARAAQGLGWITFDLPPGTHTAQLHLGRTPIRAGAEALSLAALVLPLGVAAIRRWRSAPAAARQLAQAGRAAPGWAAAVLATLGLLVAGAVLLRAWPAPTPRGPLSMDFAQLTYPHHAAVRFAGGAQLLHTEYSAAQLAAGSTLTIRSTWQAEPATRITLELVPASNLLNPAPLALSTAQVEVPAAANGPHQLEHVLPVPSHVPPGVYFVTVTVADDSAPRPALTSAGHTRGLVHLAPVWVESAASLPPTPPLADFGPSLRLAAASTTAAESALQLDVTWQALAEAPANYQIALRLRDAAGIEWAASDTQVAYGYYPTSLWQPGEVVADFYRLPLPPGTPPGEYSLHLSLYDPASNANLGTLVLPAPITTTTPAGARAAQHALTSALALADVAFPARFDQGDAPELRAGWLTLAAPGQDWRARWTLTPLPGAAPEARPHSQVLDLAPGSTVAEWPAGAYIQGRGRLGTPASLAPGPYALSVVLVDAHGNPSGQEAVVAQVEVVARPRTFEPPPLDAALNVQFGDVLTLLGYASEREGDALTMDLAWQALREPAHDYKFFVNLLSPADDFVVWQHDAVPRDFTYPTALWVAGEVVTDRVTIPLAGLGPGNYRLAVGWYDAASPGLERLPAVTPEGERLPLDRVILPLTVTVE